MAPLLASLLWTGFGVPAALLARVGLALVTETYAMWLAHRERQEHPDRHEHPVDPHLRTGVAPGPSPT
jgi:hypothetical protein